MTELIRALSKQVATVTPSPPAFVLERAPGEPRAEAGAAKAAAEPAQAPVDGAQALKDAMKSAAAQIEAYLKSTGRELQFSVDEVTGDTVVTVRDAQSGEVIRQIPNAEALRLARALGNQSSALVDISI